VWPHDNAIGEVARHGRADQQEMVVGGGLCGELAVRGIPDRGAQTVVGQHAVVGDLPAARVHRGEDVALQQRTPARR
jgi:hypothetical protein